MRRPSSRSFCPIPAAAKGGWTNDGGNIGGYSSPGSTASPINVTIAPGAFVKAGSGEGKYITTSVGNVGGAKSDGKKVFSLALTKSNIQKWVGEVAEKGEDSGTVTGDFDSVSWPLTEVTIASSGGNLFSGPLSAHMDGTADEEEGAYYWTEGQDLTVTVTNGSGNVATFKLKFSEGAGTWYLQGTEEPPDAVLPTYNNNNGNGGTRPNASGDIRIMTGTESFDYVDIPRFFFSVGALKLHDDNMNIAHRRLMLTIRP